MKSLIHKPLSLITKTRNRGLDAFRRSEAWERGESKGTNEIDFWGSCSTRALARRVRRELSAAVHGDGEVAAAWAALEAAGRVARPRSSSARLEGGGGGRPRRVGASARRINGRNGRKGAGRRRCRWTATRSRAGRWEMGIRAILKFPKIPGTSL